MNTCPRCGPAGRVVAHGRGAAACARCGGSFKLLPDAFAAFKRAGLRAVDLEAILAREGKKLHPCVTCHEWMLTFPVGHEVFHACVPCGAMWTEPGALNRVIAAAETPSTGPFAGLPRTSTPAPRQRFAQASDPFRDLDERTSKLNIPLAAAHQVIEPPAFPAPSAGAIPPAPSARDRRHTPPTGTHVGLAELARATPVTRADITNLPVEVNRGFTRAQMTAAAVVAAAVVVILLLATWR